MKNKAGLHKRVSSIFDGVPINRMSESDHNPEKNGYQSEHSMSENKLVSKEQASKRLAQDHISVSADNHDKSDSYSSSLKHHSAGNESPYSRLIYEKVLKFVASLDSRQRIMSLLVVVLVVTLIFVVNQNFTKATSSSGNLANQNTQQLPEDVFKIVETFNINWTAPPEFPKSIRDPMRFGTISLASSAMNTDAIIVSAIIYNMSKPLKSVATVNGQLVHVGDTISDIKILSISKDSVEFGSEDKTWTQKVSSKR